MTVERGMDSIHGSARVTDVASQARTAGKAAAPTPVVVRADGTVHWAALVAG
jgi:hypothetical protein